MTEEQWNYLFGGLIILFFAYRRFNTPRTSRSSTTAFRYHTAAASYSLLTLGVWFLLTRFASDRVITGLEVQGPVVSALLITGLLPYTPGLDALDRWVRDKLHAVAAIPTEVRRLAGLLQHSQLGMPDDLRRQTRERLLQLGFEEADAVFEADGSPEASWTALTALMVHLRSWLDHPRHGAFLRRLDEWRRLEQRYDALVPKARSYFRAMGHLRQASPDQLIDAVGREYRAVFVGQTDELYERACGLVSRVVLGCNATHRSRQEELASFGFSIEYKIPISADQLVAVFLLMFGLMAPVLTVIRANSGDGSLVEALALSLMISIIYSTAVVCSVYPRDRWAAWAKRAPGKRRPWRFYLVAGLMSAAAAGVLSFVTRCVLEQDLAKAWQEALTKSPWMFMAFVTAFLLALLSDDEPSASAADTRWRLLEGACLGVALVATGAMVCYLLWMGGESPRDPAWILDMMKRVLPLTATIGFILGAFVPSWYRQPEDEPDPGMVGSQVATA